MKKYDILFTSDGLTAYAFERQSNFERHLPQEKSPWAESRRFWIDAILQGMVRLEGGTPGLEMMVRFDQRLAETLGCAAAETLTPAEFGGRIDPISGQRDGHTGMDLAVPTGTPIRAALGGTVKIATYNSSYGNYVTIDHGNGLVTLYAHNSRLLVRPGQAVQAGDVVSLSGATGRVTGPHLHFEVRVNGQRTNPRYYLP